MSAVMASTSSVCSAGQRMPCAVRMSACPSTLRTIHKVQQPQKILNAFSTLTQHRGVAMHRRRGVITAAKKKEEEENVEEEEMEEGVEYEEVEEEVMEEVAIERQSILTTIQVNAPKAWAMPGVRNTAYTVGAVLGATLLWSCWNVFKKWSAPKAKRKRTVGANKYLVETLSEYLPAQRSGVTPGFINKLRFETGFKQDLIFRKYLRYMLDQRPFDTDAVADLLHLRTVCDLPIEKLLELMEESAKRTFERTGILMRKPEGFTMSGLQKKATGRATFSKLMYLADLPEFIPAEQGKKMQAKIMQIFGATDEDFEEARITTLSEADTAALEKLMGRGEGGQPLSADISEDEDEEEGSKDE